MAAKAAIGLKGLTRNYRLTERKSDIFVSQHFRPFLLFHGRLPPTSVASKIEKFGTLAACLGRSR